MPEKEIAPLKIDGLDTELKTLNAKLSLLVKQNSFLHTFIRGVLTGFGGVVGATLVVAAILWILGQLAVVPIVGTWIAEVVKIVQLRLAR